MTNRCVRVWFLVGLCGLALLVPPRLDATASVTQGQGKDKDKCKEDNPGRGNKKKCPEPEPPPPPATTSVPLITFTAPALIIPPVAPAAAALADVAVVGTAGTGWPISGNVAAGFSEPMDPLTITSDTFTLKQGATVIPAAVNYSGVTAILNPTALLAPLTTYTATVTTGARSLTGVSLATDFSWTFVTGVTVDTIQPFVTATVPLNGASSVPLNAAVTCAFSEPMNPLTFTPVSFTVTRSGAPVAGVVSYLGVTATFTPSSLLASSATYTATVTAAARDLAGNPLAFNTSWSFTTGVNLDTTAPVITATVPASGAVGVPINQGINATFSEAMNPLTVTTASLRVTGPNGVLLPGIVSYGLLTHIATLIPAVPLTSNTTYTATVSGAQDVAGNGVAATSWSFTTGTAPVSQLSVASTLGAAQTFAVLGASTVTNTGGTQINGDLGLYPGTSVTGFGPGVINGSLQVANSAAAAAQQALTVAYNDAASRTGGIVKAGNLGGQTLGPGVYTSASSLAIDSGDLILDAGGDVNAVWIFQMGSTLVTTSGRQVILANGAKASNVFWQVGSSATLGTGSVMKGTIMALASITVTTGATVEGRCLARTAAVTLDTNQITLPLP